MPAGVVHRLPHADRRRAPVLVGQDEGAPAGIDLHLQRHPQQLAVAEQALVVAGDPRRAAVEVEPLGEGGGLVGLADHLDPRSVADAPVAAADPVAGLQDRHLESGPLQLVGADEAGDPGPQDHHPGAAAGVRRKVWARLGDVGGQQAHRLHHAVDGAGPADGGDPVEELTATEGHWKTSGSGRTRGQRGRAGAVKPTRPGSWQSPFHTCPDDREARSPTRKTPRGQAPAIPPAARSAGRGAAPPAHAVRSRAPAPAAGPPTRPGR